MIIYFPISVTKDYYLRYRKVYFVLKLYICAMKQILSPKRLMLLLAFAFSVQAFASFVDNSKSKKKGDTTDLSLKNFTRTTLRNTAYPSFRLSQFQYKGSANLYQINSSTSVEGQSMIRMEHGNTAYVYPYKYKVKTPLFKTPTPPNAH